MRRLLFLLLLSVSFFAQAEQTDEYEEGFFTAYLNRAIEKAMSNDEAKPGTVEEYAASKRDKGKAD